ncbi:aquaporin TIP2-1-like [Rhodamnia argentea]|uniref:Aquaporin TIP2-1-like n=1 Tax=Rhodamnia argentea TaxID=178133 RepID=A0A8B8PKK1_9MYRT|nr:aquaporin TIP2-1-like [Rhodamnia argentea]
MRVIKVSSFLRAGSQFLDVMEELFSKSSLRSYFAEFVSTFIFVFAGLGSSISAGMSATPTAGTAGENCHTLAVAVAHAFALFAAVFASAHISGGHVNPAVTIGMVMGGHVRILSGVCFCLAQLLGSTAACILLMLLTAGQAIPTGRLAPHVTGMGGAATEFIGTFALVYTACAARDPRKGPHGIASPTAIGFVYGANFMLTGPFAGGFMNPARSFGPAAVTGDFRDHWVHWVGPIAGGGVAGLVYEIFMSQGSVNDRARDQADVV